MNYKYKQMWENLKDKEFRKQFIDAHVDEGIAFQIRSLRNKKELTQPKFAQELGVKQPLVSAWENPAYGKYSLNTLKKLAKAFDVGLLVRFVPFSSLVDWTINLTPNSIAPPSFSEEQSYYQAPTSGSITWPNTGYPITMDAVEPGFSPSVRGNSAILASATINNARHEDISMSKKESVCA